MLFASDVRSAPRKKKTRYKLTPEKEAPPT
jgi:hypothetical protein